MKKQLCVILPAYNEAKVIGEVLKKLKLALKPLADYQETLVVVDDGSSDHTTAVAKDNEVLVLKHAVNRGVGAALATGFAYAKQHEFDYTIMMDSDGQHDPNDVVRILKPLIYNQADVVIGSRLLNTKGMPWDRKLLNRLGSLVTWLFFGIWVSDSQSGFRGFNRQALQCIQIKTQGMESCSEMFDDIFKYKLRMTEIPIKVIYTSYSREKGQNNWNSVNIVTKLLLRLFRD